MTFRLLQTLSQLERTLPAESPQGRFAGERRLQSLRDSLFAGAEPLLDRGLRLHVLVDTMLGDPLEKAPRRVDAIEIPVKSATKTDARLPYLMPLGDIGRDLTIDLTLDLGFAEATRHRKRQTRGSTICAWIACAPDATPTVARALASVCRRHVVAHHDRFLRLWDPRVLELVAPALSPAERGELSAGAPGWWWIRRDGNIARLAAQAIGDETTPRTQAADGWRAPEVVELLQECTIVNGVLNSLQDADQPGEELPTPQAILQLTRRARKQWQFSDDFDLIRFALYGVLVSPQFDDDPEVRNAMKQAQASGESCMDAIAQFEENHWKQRHV